MIRFLLLCLVIILQAANLHSQEIEHISINDSSIVIWTKHLPVDEHRTTKVDLDEMSRNLPYYNYSISLASYCKKNTNPIFFFKVLFSNSYYNVLKTIDRSIELKTVSGNKIKLPYLQDNATIIKPNYKEFRTYQKTFSGSARIGTERFNYEFKVNDPNSEETTVRRVQPYMMSVLYHLSEEQINMIKTGIKEIKVMNGKVSSNGFNLIFGDGYSNTKQVFKNDIIGDYIRSAYEIIEEELIKNNFKDNEN